MLRPAVGDDRLDAALPDEVAVLVVVVAAVGKQRPRSASRTSNAAAHRRHPSSSSSSWVTSLRLPLVSVQASGTPPPSTSRWCLPPPRPRSTGLGPVFLPLFRLQMTGVGDRPLPLEPVGSVQPCEQQLVQLRPHARLLPGAQPAPRRHPAAEAELPRQMLPADPGVQHKQDPLQHAPIVERLAPRIAEPTRLAGPRPGHAPPRSRRASAPAAGNSARATHSQHA
jgi:hypothetical protein